MKIEIAAVLALCCVSSVCLAMTGNDLYRRMGIPGERQVPAFIAGVVRGYQIGRADAGKTTVFQSSAHSTEGRCFLIPEGVTDKQLNDVVRNYLAANPARRHLDAPGLVMDAISVAFPCEQ